MGEFYDNIATFFVIGGAIALISCGITIAKPNLHGVKFREGTCRILSASQRPFWRDLPTCSCGKNCAEEYPCLTIKAKFEYSGLNSSSFIGTIHHDYYALDEDCLFIPDCEKNFERNAKSVYSYFMEKIVPLVYNDMRYPYLQGYNRTEIQYKNASTFDCWGYDGAIYVDHKYSMLKVYMSLGIPFGCILLGIAVSAICGSQEHRSCLFDVLLLPFLCIGGAILTVMECFDCRCRMPRCRMPRCRMPRCNCNCFERSSSSNRSSIQTEGGGDMEISGISVRRRSIRRSISLESLELSFTPHRRSPMDRRRRSFGSLGELQLYPQRADEPVPELSTPQETAYPSSVAPPSYNNVHSVDGYEPSFTTPVAILSGPVDVSPYNSDLPPPPSYDDVVDY